MSSLADSLNFAVNGEVSGSSVGNCLELEKTVDRVDVAPGFGVFGREEMDIGTSSR